MPQFSQERRQCMNTVSGISVVAAVARNGVIGSGNQIPWRLPEDLRRFRRLTLGHAVIMGRKTFESIGNPLPERSNIVITRSREWVRPGCKAFPSFEAAMGAVEPTQKAFVIGGAEIYALALPLAGRIYLTEIDRDFAGDTTFPDFDRSQWRVISRERHELEGAGGFAYSFVEYQRDL
jgi:dihydrofolate reductase